MSSEHRPGERKGRRERRKKTKAMIFESNPMTGKSWPAPAKLNLFLHVLNRRPDGYHNLQTVFQFLDFGDELFFEPRTDGKIRRVNAIDGLAETDDLAVRAALALKKETGCASGCDIRINKRIPLGGGLGGGSSDAATALVALNQLWNLKLSEDRLAEISLALGADVPVFVRGRAAWAEGIGEKLTALELPEPWYLVVTPPCSVSTREIFRSAELPRANPPITRAQFQSGLGRNDCLDAVRRHYPPVGQALDWLSAHGRARLSGTGASVFADFPDEAKARKLASLVPEAWRWIVARGRNQSSLHAGIQL